MSTVATSAKAINWFRLQYLAGHSCICLRRLFKKRYQQFYNSAWNDTATCGTQFFNNVVSPYPQYFTFSRTQKISIQKGNSNEWDVSLLITLLLNIANNRPLTPSESQALKKEDQYLEDLRVIRNELAHHGTRQINDSDFNTSWLKLKNILVFFGEDDTELEKMKDIEFKSAKEEEDAESTKEMERLKTLGNKSFDDKNFTDAIKHYTKALTLPSLLSKNRAVLYSNLSRTRLALCEQIQDNTSAPILLTTIEDERYRALRDAKEARKFWPTWWKAHYRVGNAYSSMNEHEKAINSFECALVLDPSSAETKKALDSSKSTYSQQQRYEHLDPRMEQQTMDGHLHEMHDKYGIDPELIRLGHSLRSVSGDTAATDVINGHKYFFGDVKYGITQDYDRAAKYYASAASQGNAEGMYNLGMMYDRGQGVKKDHSLATQFYQNAASQLPHLPKSNVPNIGVAEAEHALGLRYYNGIDVNKNLAMAAHWYERSAEHGCAHAANNLGIMYLEGTGVTQDKQKAEQWFQFAARKGDINAMSALALLLLDNNNFLMARLWCNRACEAGNIMAQTHRDRFEQMISQKEAFMKQCPLNFAQMIQQMESYHSDIQHRKPTPSKQLGRNYNYLELKEYAAKGSMTATVLCQALEHFYRALFMILQSENIDESKCLHELAEAYRIEHRVVQYSRSESYNKFQLLIDQNFKNQPDNEDAQICYVYFHGDNFQQCIKVIDQLKSKNQKSVHLSLISANINCFLKRWTTAILDCNTGLKLDSKNYELHYTKAVALRCMENPDKNDILDAYRIFLENAPKDHRKVPEAYYAMAQCSFPTE
jgi:TPR repeat protein